MALTIWTFVGKVMSLLFNTLSRFVVAFLPRNKCLLISWLQSLSMVILDLPYHADYLSWWGSSVSVIVSRQSFIIVFVICFASGHPWWLSDKESDCNGGFDPWVGNILWRRAWQPTPVILPGESL